MKRLDLLKSSWTHVAKRYSNIFVKQFQPWVNDAVDALVKQTPPPGKVLVAGCGTGEEIITLAGRLPQHTFLGVDLADGMIELAREAVTSSGSSDRVDLVVGDASSIPSGLPPLAAVFSCFVLQQMPQPREALAAWTEALTPGGILTVDWEEDLLTDALLCGAQIITDTLVSHPMTWKDIDTFWEAMTRAGPWHATRLQHGENYMDALKEEFMAGYNKGSGSGSGEVVTHRPQARLLVLKRHARATL